MPALDVRFTLLDKDTAVPFAPLADPLARPHFKKVGPHSDWVAVGASQEGRPVGVALLEVIETARVLDLQIAPDRRNQGLGTALLGDLENRLRERRCPRVRLAYRTDRGAPAAMERVLQKRGWSTPELHRHLFTVGEAILQAPWLDADLHLPPDMALFPWEQLAETERLWITQNAGRWFPWEVNPLYPPEFEAVSSRGLRQAGDLAGWSVTESLPDGGTYYRCLFLSPECQARGLGRALLASGIKAQIAHGGQYGFFGVPPQNEAMLKFVEAHFGPYTAARAEEKRATLMLGQTV
jgi:ribosomal protein S18 acetylase RimI-like enzyme